MGVQVITGSPLKYEAHRTDLGAQVNWVSSLQKP